MVGEANPGMLTQPILRRHILGHGLTPVPYQPPRLVDENSCSICPLPPPSVLSIYSDATQWSWHKRGAAMLRLCIAWMDGMLCMYIGGHVGGCLAIDMLFPLACM